MPHGCRDWTDYRMQADVTPHLAKRSGIAVRVQDMRRHYGLVALAGNRLQLVRELEGTTVLAETDFDWQLGGKLDLSLHVEGDHIVGTVDGTTLEAKDSLLTSGGIALLIDEGRTATQEVRVSPA